MANSAKLRAEARNHEAREQWREAIAAYRQVVENPDSGEEADIGLWNRVGDLHLRINETEAAVQAYESAVKAYADVGLYNNAIALCRKVLRLVPGRASVYRTLGQISAAKGFLADARHYFLEFAERMRRAGRTDDSFEALKEFADLSPADTEIRRLLADQFLHHGRPNEAVEQLRILLGILLAADDHEGAARVREQIVAVDPNASTEALVREARPRERDDFGAAFDTGVLDVPSGASVTVEEAPAGVAPAPGIDTGTEEFRPPAGGVQAIEGFEPTIDPSLLPDAAPTPPSPASAAGDQAEPLPMLEFTVDGADGGDAGADPYGPGEGLEVDGGFDLADDEGEAEPLPLLDPLDYRPPPPRPSLDALRARVAAAPDDGEARRALVAELRGRGMDAEAAQALEQAHRALAAAGRHRDAVAPVSELIELRPDDGALLQKRVEYAFRSGDREALAVAYLGLGRHLRATGEEAKARAVFQRLLELDPGNAEARAAVAPPPGVSAGPPAPQAPAAPQTPAPAGGDDYVDLGALILGDEPRTTTRFVVEEKEPSGDEDRDFAEMLSHFRQKVAENIEVEDSSSHYDLGLAFKEMGLIDEAIAEFQVALRGGANPLATLEVLGQCFVEKGQYPVAARVLDRALRLPGTSDLELVGVLYLLGRAEEAVGRAQAAMEYYERVLSVDIRFRDAAARIEALRAGSGAAPL